MNRLYQPTEVPSHEPMHAWLGKSGTLWNIVTVSALTRVPAEPGALADDHQAQMSGQEGLGLLCLVRGRGQGRALQEQPLLVLRPLLLTPKLSLLQNLSLVCQAAVSQHLSWSIHTEAEPQMKALKAPTEASSLCPSAQCRLAAGNCWFQRSSNCPRLCGHRGHTDAALPPCHLCWTSKPPIQFSMSLEDPSQTSYT